MALTQAERALHIFRTAKRTTSLPTIAAQFKADKTYRWDKQHVVTIYTFDDDTSLRVTGRGRGHRVEVLLP